MLIFIYSFDNITIWTKNMFKKSELVNIKVWGQTSYYEKRSVFNMLSFIQNFD